MYNNVETSTEPKPYTHQPCSTSTGAIVTTITVVALAIIVGGALAIQFTVGFPQAFRWVINTMIHPTWGQIILVCTLTPLGIIAITELTIHYHRQCGGDQLALKVYKNRDAKKIDGQNQ